MTTKFPPNPLDRGGGGRGAGGPLSVDDLRDYVEKCNNFSWVVNSGKLYYLASRVKADGTIEHFVDRHI